MKKPGKQTRQIDLFRDRQRETAAEPAAAKIPEPATTTATQEQPKKKKEVVEIPTTAANNHVRYYPIK